MTLDRTYIFKKTIKRYRTEMRVLQNISLVTFEPQPRLFIFLRHAIIHDIKLMCILMYTVFGLCVHEHEINTIRVN